MSHCACTEPRVVAIGQTAMNMLPSIKRSYNERAVRSEGSGTSRRIWSTSDSQPSINVKPCNILIWLSIFFPICHFFLVRFTHCVCVSFVTRVSLAVYQEDEFQVIPYILHASLHACSGLVMLVVACRWCRQFGWWHGAEGKRRGAGF